MNGTIETDAAGCVNPVWAWTGPGGPYPSVPVISNLGPGTYGLTFTHSLGTEVYSWVLTEDIFQNHNWAVHPVGVEGHETIIDMAVDQQGDVYVIGTYMYQIHFGNNVNGNPVSLYNTEQSTRAVFVAKWDYCGYIEAARTIAWNDINTDSVNLHIELLNNNTGPVVIAGDFEKKYNITGTTVITTGGYDIFLGILANSTLAGLQQATITSTGGPDLNDRFKGMSAEGGSFAFCGSFRGNTVTIPGYPNNITLTNHLINSGNSDYFHCLYNWNGTLLSLQWATINSVIFEYRFNEHGMTMQYISPYIYYAFKKQINIGGYYESRGFLAQVNAANGALIATAMIDPGGLNKFYEIQDMARHDGYLYACGYRHDPATPWEKQAVVLKYTTTINNPAYTRVSSPSPGANYNSANKIYVDNSGVYVSGTYQQNNFTFGGPPLPINLFGQANHFVLKTNLSLTPRYLKCMISSPNGASSLGNAISYDATRDVFYIAGTFTNTMVLSSFQGQTLTAPNNWQDAFIARFEDLGNDMEFKNQIHNNGFVRAMPNISMYPNPTTGMLQVNSSEPITGIVITDISGREFIPVVAGIEAETLTINLGHLQEGTYIVKVCTPGNVKIEKVNLTK
jgi:hypothetical protein